jgi:hypothetical protein
MFLRTVISELIEAAIGAKQDNWRDIMKQHYQYKITARSS